MHPFIRGASCVCIYICIWSVFIYLAGVFIYYFIYVYAKAFRPSHPSFQTYLIPPNLFANTLANLSTNTPADEPNAAGWAPLFLAARHNHPKVCRTHTFLHIYTLLLPYIIHTLSSRIPSQFPYFYSPTYSPLIITTYRTTPCTYPLTPYNPQPYNL